MRRYSEMVNNYLNGAITTRCFGFFIIAVQTPGSGISILLAVGTPSTGTGNLYCQWELSPGSGNALCILFPTTMLEKRRDRWVWSLEGSGEFFVASVRRLIDDNLFPEVASKTCWIKMIPIKSSCVGASHITDDSGISSLSGVSSLTRLVFVIVLARKSASTCPFIALLDISTNTALTASSTADRYTICSSCFIEMVFNWCSVMKQGILVITAGIQENGSTCLRSTLISSFRHTLRQFTPNSYELTWVIFVDQHLLRWVFSSWVSFGAPNSLPSLLSMTPCFGGKEESSFSGGFFSREFSFTPPNGAWMENVSGGVTS
nr:RNA-directed DNA polymerase, eukaryota [Tanacetum cinerariifolium]